jgi:hypothetical protein
MGMPSYGPNTTFGVSSVILSIDAERPICKPWTQRHARAFGSRSAKTMHDGIVRLCHLAGAAQAQPTRAGRRSGSHDIAQNGVKDIDHALNFRVGDGQRRHEAE